VVRSGRISASGLNVFRGWAAGAAMPARAREAQPAEQRQQRDRRASLIILRSIPYIMENNLQNSMFLATQVSNLAWQLTASPVPRDAC
jgi:hypothetical protein